MKLPFDWSDEAPEDANERLKLYQNPASTCTKVVISRPDKVVMPPKFPEIAEAIYNLELRPDDVWVVTYPKCGTTWTQEMVWQICNNFDAEGGKTALNLRYPFIEMESLLDPTMEPPEKFKKWVVDMNIHRTVAYVNEMPSPRFIKSHLPLHMLPPTLLDTCKVIFTTRNPRDCCVSYFYHEQMWDPMGYTGDFESYQKFFREGKVIWGDYWVHMKAAWGRRNKTNLKILWYEDMKEDLSHVIRDVASFLDCQLTDDKVSQLNDHLHFDSIRDNPAVNYEIVTNEETGQRFMRKGQVGDWKRHLSTEDSQVWEKWVEKRLADTGINRDFMKYLK